MRTDADTDPLDDLRGGGRMIEAIIQVFFIDLIRNTWSAIERKVRAFRTKNNVKSHTGEGK
jgi:hypothetical protein